MIVFAVDCGPAVNPGHIEAQIQGGVILALSTTLKEQVHFANGGVKSANFDDCNVDRMGEVPEIEVYVLRSTEKIGRYRGIGRSYDSAGRGQCLFQGDGRKDKASSAQPW